MHLLRLREEGWIEGASAFRVNVGDVVELGIEKLGTQRQTVIAAG